MRTATLLLAMMIVISSQALEYSCSVERADFDGNGVVNFLDIAQFNGCFLADVMETPSCAFADLDNSGSVNFIDYAQLTDNYLNEVVANRAAPWLQNRTPSVIGSSALFSAGADIDGDGLTDSVAVSIDPLNPELIVTRNLGDYQYAEPAVWASLELSTNPRVSDIDGDGQQDIAFAGTAAGSSAIHIHLLDADNESSTLITREVFGPGSPFIIGTHRYLDISGDNHPDIVGFYREPSGSDFDDFHGFFIYESTAAGQWSGVPIFIDFNPEGVASEDRVRFKGPFEIVKRQTPLGDVLLISGSAPPITVKDVLFQFGKSLGVYQLEALLEEGTTTLFRDIHVADFTGDGFTDVLYTGTDHLASQYWFLTSDTSGEFSDAVSISFSGIGKVLGTLPDDQGSVYVAAGSSSIPGLVLGSLDEQGIFTQALAVEAPSEITGVSISGQGSPGELVAHFSGDFYDGYNIGISALFQGVPLMTFQPFPESVEGTKITADIDGDLSPDIVATSGDVLLNEEGEFTLLRNQLVFDDTPTQTWIAIGDLNRDGKPDVVSRGVITRQLVSHIAGENLVFTEVDRLFYSVTNAIQIVDMNGDGHPDVMLGSGYSPGDGTGALLPVVSLGVDNSAWQTTDLNNDGHLDVLYSLSDPFRYVVLFGAGNGVYNLQQEFTFSYVNEDQADFQAPGLIDIDRDGNLDLISVLAENFSVYSNPLEIVIATGHGDGTFTQTQSILDENLL